MYPNVLKHCSRVSCSFRKMSTAKAQTMQEDATTNYDVYKDWKEHNNEVIFLEKEHAGIITLNRPEASNALKVPMCKRMIETLKDWESKKKFIIIEGVGDKAFCAGGDLRLLKYATAPDVDFHRRNFFGTLYRLFHLIGTYKLPQVVLMNNATMGNGAGLSLHAKYRIITERSMFAMPEASLGFYPDAGTSHVFPKLPGHLGLFLGLTCYKLKATDILACGIATHFVPSEKLKDLKQTLLDSPNVNLEEVISSYQPTNIPKQFSLLPHLEAIERCFSAPTVEEIIQRLEADKSDWSKRTQKAMRKMSPTSLKVIHHIHQIARDMTFTECVKMEFRLSCTFITPESDFRKGALAMTNKLDTPIWTPSKLEDVRMEDILQRFEPLHPDKELQL